LPVSFSENCPDCGLQLPSEPEFGGLCPRCLLRWALIASPARGDPGSDSDLPTLAWPSQFDAESPTALYPEPLGEEGKTFAPGQLLGDRYRIESLLGRGGMGEVWRAYDLKLRLEVALKSLHPKLFATEDALELLRDEVRAAREVTSPNVCRLYDLVEVGDLELVSMEYVDGVTLLEHLKQHGPLDLREANEIASQLLAGMEAIHQAGLVHRDIKPENVMLTRTGRVVVMDFGLTSPSGSGSVGGTPAYMPPEQARGGATDARADVFSAGMVLAEMLSAERGPEESSRQTFWEEIRQDPPVLPDSPWKQILTQAVSPEAEKRFSSAQELARALEEVAFRVEGVEHEHPYPGLSSFKQEDAEFFFGREAEVEAVWKRLQQSHLLGLIGPSGSGKSSFINAGLLPASPEGWFCVRMTPSTDPFAALGRALLSELETDTEAMGLLASLEGPEPALEVLRRSRAMHAHLLLVVDQFEELFTQSSEDIQRRFAELLGRAGLDADVHVLLSMRDDYLFQCQTFEILRPLFSELTPLGPPTGSSLRRAIVQPALRCGYRFEDEAEVEEMLQEVTKERAALPLIAFTAAQLWELRDQETGYLTKDAYEEIGGVGGALAQHAEATLERIGEDHIPTVRELFRNLVTADGTRASRDRDELLSVFDGRDTAGRGAGRFKRGERRSAPDGVRQLKRPDPVPAEPIGPDTPTPLRPYALEPSGSRSSAAEILDALIDARLLTSYEIPEREERPGRQRIEIIHESLLTAWPRLVRWQMQDAEGAKLREELRHQAQVWFEKDRPDDLLWTGMSYREFEIWRERYPGGLTTTEETFVGAMITKAQRRKRRRQLAITTVLVLVSAVAIVTGVLWRRSETAREQAVVAEQEATTQARRAEAGKLHALGRVELDRDPTIALAYALASLELDDSAATRRFALEALWSGPAYFSVPPTGSPPAGVDFSPDERWLAIGYGGTGDIHIWSRAGGEPIRLGGHGGIPKDLRFGASSDVLVTAAWMDVDNTVRVWSVPDGKPLFVAEGTADPDWRTFVGIMPAHLSSDGSRLITYQANSDWTLGRIRAWTLDGTGPQDLGVFSGAAPSWCIDPSGRWILYRTLDMNKGEINILPIAQLESASPRVVTHYEKKISDFGWDFHDQRIAFETGGEIRIRSIGPDSTALVRSLRAPATVWAGFRFDESGSLLAAAHDEGLVSLWDLNGPAGADPLILKYPSENDVDGIALQASGRWLAASNDEGGVRLWPLGRTYPWVLKGHRGEVRVVAFTPDGTGIASSGFDGHRYWPLTQGIDEAPWQVSFRASGAGEFAFDPAGRFIVIAPRYEEVRLLPLGGGDSRTALAPEQLSRSVAVSPDGDSVAWGGGLTEKERVIHVWDLPTDEVRVLDAGREEAINYLEFTPDGRLLAAYGPLSTGSSNMLGGGPLRRWNVEEGTQEIFMDEVQRFDLSRDGRFVLSLEGGHVIYHDLEQGRATELPGLEADGNTTSLALDPTGTIAVTGSEEGMLRVAPVTGEEPHLLMGHEASVYEVAVSPDGRWIASASADATLRLWPMPEGLPFHTLPYEELLAKLRSLTNLRVVRDSESSTGWKVEIGTFPGWEEVPTW